MTTENDIVTIPSWINNTLVEKALNNNELKEVNHVEVDGCVFDIGTSPGDNYSSVIYRAKVKLNEGREKTLLIKTVIEGEEMEKLAEQNGSFVRETLMLDNIVPRIQELLEEAAPGRWSRLTAKCLLHGDKPKRFIVMDDMRLEGFRMSDRKRGLGLRHSLLAMRALARYHAGGHVLIKKDPSLFPQLQNPFRVQPEKIHIFIEGGIDATAQVCKTWPGYEEISRRLENFKMVVMDTYSKLHELKPELFNVISHGDFWNNNLLFRYDEDGNPTDIRMVDLQFSSIESPALDIIYFLTTSLSEEVSTHHEQLLIREYYFALQEALSLLGMEAPSFDSLLADIDAHGPHSLLGNITVHPLVKATTPLDLESVFGGDLTTLIALYNSPEIKRYLQRVLPELTRKGWLPAIDK